MDDLYCFPNAKDPDQIAEMKRLDELGICFFCWPELGRQIRAGRQALLVTTDHWMVTPNRYPYPGTSQHLLLVPTEHVSAMHDLSPEAQAEFWGVLSGVVSLLQLGHYSLGVRNGDCQHTGATISHVHVHLLVADSESEDAAPVRMRFSGRK